MFAVPGWAVSAESLVTQKEPPKSSRKEAGGLTKASKKRKRGQAIVVTEENVDELWRKNIEGEVTGGQENEQRRKRGKKRKEEVKENAQTVKISESRGEAVEGVSKDTVNAKAHKKKEKKKKKLDSSEAQLLSDREISLPEKAQKKEPQKDGKAQYEERKALALEKQAKKALEQANGSATSLQPTLQPPKTTVKAKNTKPPREGGKTAPNKDRDPSVTVSATVDIASPPNIKLTPLQTVMQQKLISSRFRHLNETLYTTPSQQASSLFSEPANYNSYHAGFRAQVAVWPQNPINTFIADIKTRARLGRGGRQLSSQKKNWRDQKRGKSNNNSPDEKTEGDETPKLDPLPRSPRGLCTIADLGCGDAILAGILKPLSSKLSLWIHSFDLAKGDGPNASLITIADICTRIPLADSSIDLAIFCLALMGTNWVMSLIEAARVVRPGGELWIAEIKSRFSGKLAASAAAKKKNNNNNKGIIGKRRKKEEEERQEMEHVDAEDLKKKDKEEEGEETDLGDFIQLCAKKGFVLKQPPDTSNKMFARLRFLRAKKDPSSARSNVAGKRTTAEERDGMMPRFIDRDRDDEEEEDVYEQGKLLKPCVYKVR
ncbi:25S rRNA (adenine645-N1)-methyltransferase [Peltigera leucophlebia]|nr:25S rRNA (adenine645-N1)-methyltransferase [Peltigera leucophlebia]